MANKIGFNIFFLCTFLSFLPSISFSDVDGFRSFKWGESLESIKKKSNFVVMEENKERKVTFGIISNDNLKIGGATLVNVGYSFWDEKLLAVIIFTRGSLDFKELVNAAEQKYGKMYKDYTKPGSPFVWSDSLTEIIAEYNNSGEIGMLGINSKKIMEEKTKGDARRAKEGAMDF